MSDLVGNPEDLFSRNTAEIGLYGEISKVLCDKSKDLGFVPNIDSDQPG